MKILITDDVKGWRDYHKNVISKLYPDADIETAEFAQEGYDRIMENNSSPYDVVITDLQMESDFIPLYAGEWLIERIKEMRNYYKTRIIIISAAYNIRTVAEKYNVDYIPKAVARSDTNIYEKFLR